MERITVAHTRDDTALVSLDGFAETIVVSLALRPGNWIVLGRTSIYNRDSDSQNASIALRTRRDLLVIDRVDVSLPRAPTSAIHGEEHIFDRDPFLLQGVVSIRSEDAVDIICATYRGSASLPVLIAFPADTLSP
ncbi:hypothetical protein H4W29_003878 [Rhizobium viscosum]|uniref:Uncharacterized protein n=1 Tax=Rhizobium viscosum TaxID=1673 RepID=A0ABR9IU26_RHIVS|nr:hypothetical protein [Rhizobium viscosum]